MRCCSDRRGKGLENMREGKQEAEELGITEEEYLRFKRKIELVVVDATLESYKKLLISNHIQTAALVVALGICLCTVLFR
jgi:hypothetical protein